MAPPPDRARCTGLFRWFRCDSWSAISYSRSPAVEYRKLLEEARDLQRKGDIQGFAAMTARTEALAQRIDAIKAGKTEAKG